MGDTVIRVENLSKKYVLSHQQDKDSHKTLRDAIAAAATSLLKPLTQNSKLKTQNPSKEEFWALKDVSFEIKQGDRVGIIGRNGAGKSTLLKILSRIVEPTSGRIRIKGRVASLLEVGTGFHPELTGRENVFLNGAILGMSREEIKRKFDEIIAFAEIEKFLDTPVKRYSSGMYVRLAFAVAAHLEPEILIVDEVLAVGDAAFQRKCLGKMQDVGKEGRTVLFVSHNMTAITALCDRSIYFKKGEKILDGSASEVAVRYNTESLSITEKSNLLNVERRGTGKAKFKSLNIKAIDEFGIPSAHAYPGCDLLIETILECSQGIPDSNVAVIIYDSNGYRIIDVNTAMKGRFISMKERELVEVSFKLKELLLKPGNYLIGLWLGRGGIEDIDSIEYASKFTIQNKPEETKNVETFPGPYLCKFENRVGTYSTATSL